MDQLTTYKKIIQQELESRISNKVINAVEHSHKLIIDEEKNNFILLSMGWIGKRYKCEIVYHFEVKDGKIWIHQDNTDVGIAEIISSKGIPKSNIVLAYFPKYARALSSYAVA
ncbi:MAG: element excision factor XisI family protein [Bacteroidota bacterium]